MLITAGGVHRSVASSLIISLPVVWRRRADFDVVIFARILLVILLLRMLMAMLTATFAGVRQAMTLEWRIQFCRLVAQYELIAMRTGVETAAGKRIGQSWCYEFETYDEVDVAPISASRRALLAPPKAKFTVDTPEKEKSLTKLKMIRTSKNLNVQA